MNPTNEQIEERIATGLMGYKSGGHFSPSREADDFMLVLEKAMAKPEWDVMIRSYGGTTEVSMRTSLRMNDGVAIDWEPWRVETGTDIKQTVLLAIYLALEGE